MSVSIEHLYKSIGNTPILQDINLSIKQGEIVGLLGPNGAGKSTLMKILTGLWQFDSGNISICGTCSVGNQMPHSVASLIGYLPENNPLYEDMYIMEYLRFMAEISKDITTDLSQLVSTVGLTPMLKKKIRELSKGYRQRVGLAQALMGQPKLLILDEPTTGLDPNQLDDIRSLIKQLAQKHTIILSTHILQEVEAVCSRVVILAEGQIREDTHELNHLEQLFREKTTNYNQ